MKITYIAIAALLGLTLNAQAQDEPATPAQTTSTTQPQKKLTINLAPKELVKQIPKANERFNIQQAARAGRNWLKLMDERKFGESWEQASILVKKNVDKETFIKEASRSRLPLGDFVKRRVTLIEPSHQLPGSPKGEYVLMTFETKFNNVNNPVKELVMIQKDPDESWRVAGYYIR